MKTVSQYQGIGLDRETREQIVHEARQDVRDNCTRNPYNAGTEENAVYAAAAEKELGW